MTVHYTGTCAKGHAAHVRVPGVEERDPKYRPYTKCAERLADKAGQKTDRTCGRGMKWEAVETQ
jgi:hypothetical protein